MASGALPGEGELRRRSLGGATAAGSKLANVIEEDGALHVVELRGVHGDLGGHAQRAKDLLTQADAEIRQAANVANSNRR